jgi:hypothetical protein
MLILLKIFVHWLQENPCQHPIVILKDVSYDDVSALLSFMYQGEVYITQDRLSSFLRTAEFLHVRGLTGASNPFKDSVSYLTVCIVQYMWSVLWILLVRFNELQGLEICWKIEIISVYIQFVYLVVWAAGYLVSLKCGYRERFNVHSIGVFFITRLVVIEQLLLFLQRTSFASSLQCSVKC